MSAKNSLNPPHASVGVNPNPKPAFTVREGNIAELTPDNANANKGTMRGAAMLEKSLETNGAGRSVLADKHGMMIAGNKTLEQAAALGFDDAIFVESDGTKLVVVVRTDLDLNDPDDLRARELAIADNRIAQVDLEWDNDVLQKLGSQGVDLSGLFDSDELAGLGLDVQAMLTGGVSEDDAGVLDGHDPDNVPSPDQVTTRAKTGDIWQLGPHKLMVGDCTNTENLARLMKDDKVRCVWTDPPYGVSYVEMLQNRPDGHKTKHRVIANDSMTPEATEALACAALTGIAAHCHPGATSYVAAPSGTLLFNFDQAMMNSPFSLKHHLVWVKDRFTLGRCDYHYRHESILVGTKDEPGAEPVPEAMPESDHIVGPDGKIYRFTGAREGEGWDPRKPVKGKCYDFLLYGWIENGAHYFSDNRTLSTVLEFPKPARSDLHPTMKPVDLVAKCIENSTQKRDIVWDSFTGSGTTLMACQILGRVFRGTELDEQYADIIIARWEQATGREATLLERV